MHTSEDLDWINDKPEYCTIFPNSSDMENKHKFWKVIFFVLNSVKNS